MMCDMPRWKAFVSKMKGENKEEKGGTGKTAGSGAQSVREVSEDFQGACEGGEGGA